MRAVAWLGICLVACSSEQGPSFVTADEDIGGLGGLDASLDRISSKLQQEKMNRLLSLDTDTDATVTGLSALLKDDAVTKDAVKTVRSVTPIEPPRLKQVSQADTTLKTLKEQVSTMLSQQASILAKQDNVEKELVEIRSSLNKRETNERDAATKLEKIKNDIINGVSQTIEQSKQVQAVDRSPRFQQQERVDDSMRKSVLTALKKTLADLKTHVMRSQSNKRVFQTRATQFDNPYGQISPMQPMQEYDEQAAYSDQSVGPFTPEFSN